MSKLKNTNIKSLYFCNGRLHKALTLLLLASVFLFHTNANCHKPNQNNAEETVPTQYTNADYKSTGACNNPDFLFERNTETHEYTDVPDAVGKGTGACNADGKKNGEWTLQYQAYNPKKNEANKRISHSGTGKFENGKKVGTWTYRSVRTENQYATTQNYTDGNLQSEEEIRYDADGTTKQSKFLYAYNGGRLQKLTLTLYQTDGATEKQQSVYLYNNGKLQASEATIYQNDGKKTQKKSVFTYTDGKLQKEDATTYKTDGVTKTSETTITYNNGIIQKEERIDYENNGTTPQTKEVTYYDSSGKEIEDKEETYTYKNGQWEANTY